MVKSLTGDADTIVFAENLGKKIEEKNEYTTTSTPDAGVLPDAGIVVFDEAHELEDVATNYFGVTVSNLRVDELLRDVEHTLRRADLPLTDISTCATVKDRSQFFFSLLPPGEGRFAFENRPEFLEENGDEYLGLQNALLHLYTELQAIPNKPDEVHALAAAWTS